MAEFNKVGGQVDCRLVNRRNLELAGFQTPNNPHGTGARYIPDGQTTKIGTYSISSEVFNAICNAKADHGEGLPDEYLFTVAAIESGFDRYNQNPSRSKAAGLFQFIKDTGAGLGISTERAPNKRLARTPPYNAYPVYDPVINANAGAIFSVKNLVALKNGGITNPTGADLYLAHFNGAAGALKLIRNVRDNPNVSAASSVSSSVKTENQTIYYKNVNGVKVERTFQEVYDKLTNLYTSRSNLFKNLCTGAPKPVDGYVHDGALTWKLGWHLQDRLTVDPSAPQYQPNLNLISGKIKRAAATAGITQLTINSSHRYPASENHDRGGATRSYHIVGAAMDVGFVGDIPLATKRAFLQAAINEGVTGIGIGSTYMHLDVRSSLIVSGPQEGFDKGDINAGPKVAGYYGNATWGKDILLANGFTPGKW